MDKAYGIEKLMETFSFNKEDVLFIGDAIYENGNDYPVFLLGVDTVKVSSPEDTKKVIKGIINSEEKTV